MAVKRSIFSTQGEIHALLHKLRAKESLTFSGKMGNQKVKISGCKQVHLFLQPSSIIFGNMDASSQMTYTLIG